MLYFNEHKLKIAVTPKGLLVFNNWLRWVQFHFRTHINAQNPLVFSGFLFFCAPDRTRTYTTGVTRS